MEAIDCSILIPHYGDLALLDACLASIAKYPPRRPYEVLVFAPRRHLGGWRPVGSNLPVRWWTDDRPCGYGAAVNRLAKKAAGEILVIINNDIEFLQTGLEEWIERNSIASGAILLGPLLWQEDNTIQPSARRFPSPLTPLFGRRSLLRRLLPAKPGSCRDLIMPPQERRQERRSFRQQVDWINGAFLVVGRRFFEQLGGFDEGFFLYWEDADLAQRAQDAGGKVIYDCGYEALHKTSKATASLPPTETVSHFHASILRYLEKHYFPGKSQVWVTAVRGLVRLHYGAAYLAAILRRLLM